MKDRVAYSLRCSQDLYDRFVATVRLEGKSVAQGFVDAMTEYIKSHASAARTNRANALAAIDAEAAAKRAALLAVLEKKK